MLRKSYATARLGGQARVWLTRSFSSTSTPASSSTASPPVSVGDELSHQEAASVAVEKVGLSKASDIVFRGTMEEDIQGGARHAPMVSRLWSNVPVHVRESFKAPARLEDSPKPAAPLLVDSVISGLKQLAVRSGMGPSHWNSDVGRPYYGGRIELAPYKKGQTAAFNYPSILVPRELAHRFPLDMYVDPVFQTSDAAQRIRMRGFTLFPRLQHKTTLLLIFSGQPLSGLWTGLRQWLDVVGEDFKELPNTQVFKLHCEEGWFNRRTHQLTKFQLRRQVDESEIWSTFVYRGAWKWEYEHALHLYNKDLPVVLLLDAVGYIRWHAVGLPTDEATQIFRSLAKRLAHEKRNFT